MKFLQLHVLLHVLLNTITNTYTFSLCITQRPSLFLSIFHSPN
ncbi:hypothetical protein GLYMA_17G197250v4 [Glycine max]|nr:hypothetical protein GLYMA_17G197250v4 [Glycine max]